MEEAQVVVLSSRVVDGRRSSSFEPRHLHKCHRVSSCYGKYGDEIWALRTPFLGVTLRKLVHQGSFFPFSSIRFFLLSFFIYY